MSIEKNNEITVKVLDIDSQGRINLSMKDLEKGREETEHQDK